VAEQGFESYEPGVLRVFQTEKETKAFEWTHPHFPNLMDCRPIYVRPALEASGFRVKHAETKNMWVPVEIVLGTKET
jgi:hypothetical protein